MKSRAQHVALELGLPLKEFVKLAEATLGLHINNLNMMLSPDHVAKLKAAASRGTSGAPSTVSAQRPSTSA